MEGFVADPTLVKFELCRKDDFILIADPFRIVVNEALSKRKINVLFVKLVDIGVLVVPAEVTQLETGDGAVVVLGSADVAVVDGEAGGGSEKAVGAEPVVKPKTKVAKQTADPASSSSLDSDSSDSFLSARLERKEREEIRDGEERERASERAFQVELRKIEMDGKVRLHQRVFSQLFSYN